MGRRRPRLNGYTRNVLLAVDERAATSAMVGALRRLAQLGLAETYQAPEGERWRVTAAGAAEAAFVRTDRSIAALPVWRDGG